MKRICQILLLFTTFCVQSQGAFINDVSLINENEIYRNEFTSLTGITVDEYSNGDISFEAPIGTNTLEGTALTMEWTNSSGSNPMLARIPLDSVYNDIYVQFYGAIINSGSDSDYTEFFYATNTSPLSSEAFVLETNHSAGYHSYYKTETGTALVSDRLVKQGVWDMFSIHIDNVAHTATFFYNGKQTQSVSIQSREVQWLQFGGFHTEGYKMQIMDLTVNTTNFSAPTDNLHGIGDHTRIYIDSSMDSGIDASGFSGQHSELYSLDGGSTYIDGPLRYAADMNASYFRYEDGFVMQKVDGTYYQKDLATSNKLNFVGSPTSATENFTVTSYGKGEKPIIRNGILYEGSWVEIDAVNNVWESDPITTGFANLSSVRVYDVSPFGLRLSTDTDDFDTDEGIWYKDTDTVQIKLWDDVDPNTYSEIVFGSNAGLSFNDYTKAKNLHFQLGGLVAGTGVEITYCEFSKGAGLALTNGTAKYNYFHDNWTGGNYHDSHVSRGGAVVTLGDYARFAYNTVEEAYIGLEVPWGTKDPMIAFNLFQNIIVNTVTFNGGSTGHAGFNESIKMYFNTILVSPKHTQDDPYNIPQISIGHGAVFQASGGSDYVEIYGNLFLGHYNTNDLGGSGGANLLAHSSNVFDAIIDYNAYYRTPESGASFTLFHSSDGDDFALHKTRLAAYEGFNSGPVEGNSIILGSLPIQSAVYGIDTEWGEVDITPTDPLLIGVVPNIDLSAYNLRHDGSGRKLTGNRNIGAK